MNGDAAWPFRPWVRVDRGGLPESFHEGLLAVVDEDGALLTSWGDPGFTAFVRSSLKMIQALPLVESGAADAFGLEPAHLALTCASHAGEPFHVTGVREILRRAAVPESALQCGAHAPLHRESARDLVRRGEAPSPVHNNCSGKHAGMLATCAHRGWDLDGYRRADHPLQVEIAAVLGELAGLDPRTIERRVDGCGVPAFRVPVVRFAHAVARFVSGRASEARARAAGRLFRAMSTHPEMVGGTARFCTELVRVAGRPLLAKGGAEGFYVAAWHEAGRGVALAAKAASGDQRGRDFAVVEALHQLGVLDAAGVARLAPFHSGPLRNHAGDEVGRMVSLMNLERK
jgi:L-asparaginase II